MTDQSQQQPLNGYLTASQLLTKAINDGITSGVTIDEMFAALKVQCEVINLRLSQIMFENHQRDLRAAQEAAMKQAAEEAAATPEGEANAN